MLLKEKGDWGQQTLQALVEFQCKAVKTQQTITFIDAICLVSGAPHSAEWGEEVWRDHNTNPVTCEGSHLSACGEYTEHTVVTGTLTIRVQHNKVHQRHRIHMGYRLQSLRALCTKGSLEKMTVKRRRDIKEMRSKSAATPL